jgi:hypothetical protein
MIALYTGLLPTIWQGWIMVDICAFHSGEAIEQGFNKAILTYSWPWLVQLPADKEITVFHAQKAPAVSVIDYADR